MVKKWAFLGGPKSWFLAQKSVFCHTTPLSVNDLSDMVHFPRWERFFDFSFPSYGRYHKKKKRSTCQKVFPLSTALWGHRLPVTALALSADKKQEPFQNRDCMCPTHIGYDRKVFFATFHLEMLRMKRNVRNLIFWGEKQTPLQTICSGVKNSVDSLGWLYTF